MRLVKANEKTTLVLNSAWIPTGFFTAKNAIRVLLVGGASALDKNYMQHDWDSWTGDLPHESEFDDQLYIQCPNRHIRVPTILLVRNLGFNQHKLKRKHPSLRQLYAMYDGTCQYCLKPVKYSNATREHVIPKAIGGTNDDFNIVLACRKCNSTKADIYPYMNVNGEEVKSRTLRGVYFSLMTLGVNVRNEWESLLFKD